MRKEGKAKGDSTATGPTPPSAATSDQKVRSTERRMEVRVAVALNMVRFPNTFRLCGPHEGAVRAHVEERVDIEVPVAMWVSDCSGYMRDIRCR